MTKLHPDEGDVKAFVKKCLKAAGWFYFMPSANAFGKNGVHDFICLKNGILLTIETKHLKTQGTPLQQEFERDINEHGGFTRLVNTANMADLPLFLTHLEARHSR